MSHTRANSKVLWLILIAVAIVVAALVAAGAIVGLAILAWLRQPGPLAKLVVQWPGASAEEIDQVIGHPLLVSLASEDVVLLEVASISGDGRCELYARAAPLTEDARLVGALTHAAATAQTTLPLDADPPVISSLSPQDKIPHIRPKIEPQMTLHLDAERLAAHGLSRSDAMALLERSLGPGGQCDPSNFGTIVLALPDGTSLPLTEIAELEVVDAPDFVVRNSVADGP